MVDFRVPRAEGVAVNFLPDFKLAAPKYFRVATPDSNRTLGINPTNPVPEPRCGARVRGAGCGARGWGPTLDEALGRISILAVTADPETPGATTQSFQRTTDQAG